MELKKITIATSELKKLSKEERVFFILASHVFNELNALIKLTLYSDSNKKDKNTPESFACETVNFNIHTILAGKAVYAWELFEKYYIDKPIEAIVKKLIENCEHKNLVADYRKTEKKFNKVKEYFETHNNFLRRIRNKFAFHVDDQLGDIIDSLIDETENNDEVTAFIGENYNNMLFNGATSFIMKILFTMPFIDKKEFEKIFVQTYWKALCDKGYVNSRSGFLIKEIIKKQFWDDFSLIFNKKTEAIYNYLKGIESSYPNKEENIEKSKEKVKECIKKFFDDIHNNVIKFNKFIISIISVLLFEKIQKIKSENVLLENVPKIEEIEFCYFSEKN